MDKKVEEKNSNNNNVVNEEVKIVFEKKKEKNKRINNNLLIKVFIVIVIIAAFLFFIKRFFKNDSITSLDRILKEKYYSIECLNSSCTEVAAYKGSQTGKSKVTLLKSNGDEVANYIINYKADASTTTKPYALGDEFFLSKATDNDTKNVKSYSILNKKGKEVYKTEKSLKLLTNNLVILEDTNKGINSYSILDKNGKIIFEKVNDYDVFANQKIVSIETNGTKMIIDEKGKILENNYYVVKEIDDKDNIPLYLIIKDSKNNGYNYFSIESKKIIGDNFQNYTVKDDNTLIVTKKENNDVVNYSVSIKGKQEKIGVNKTQTQIINELKNSIDTKYTVYNSSINNETQNYVFVDDLTNKAFGVYNLKSKKFEKLFDYKSDAKSIYSTIYSLTSEDKNNYYQVTCSTYVCDKAKVFVYDLTNGELLFKSEEDDSIIQKYYQYTNDYKVLYYSYSSSNSDKKGKYILLGKDNKELARSSKGIVVLNEDLLIGNSITSSIILYSTKNNKLLNDENSLATKLNLNGNDYYRYSSKDNIIIVDKKGKELLNVKSTVSLVTSDSLITYVENNKIYMLNTSNGKIKNYSLKENEKMNDASGDLISPYRGVIFINNTSDNYFKLVNSKGSIIKTIKKAEIDNVYYTSDKDVVIITRNDTKNIVNYGLYIAK